MTTSGEKSELRGTLQRADLCKLVNLRAALRLCVLQIHLPKHRPYELIAHPRLQFSGPLLSSGTVKSLFSGDVRLGKVVAGVTKPVLLGSRSESLIRATVHIVSILG